MVDLDNLSRISNTGRYPNLLNSSDVDNVREIVDVHSDIFASSTDNGCAIIKSPTLDTRYGFRFQIPTGISQYTYFDGSVGENKLFTYLTKFKYLYFKNTVLDFELIDLQPVPLFAPTIEALCQLATEITGNSDNDFLKGFLEIVENIDSGIHDYEISTLCINRVDKTLKIGLDKVSDTSVSEDVFKYLGTRSNTKAYQNIKGLSQLIEDILNTDDKNVQMYLTVDSTGLLKQIGYSLFTRWKKDAPEGSDSQKNWVKFSEYHENHKNNVGIIANKAQTLKWIPDAWAQEISTWELENRSVYASTVVTTNSTNTDVEVAYGINDY
tara:strand:- start:37 stop:1011 length:975 start_codon:yes stop_codon:yes gene_type:complete